MPKPDDIPDFPFDGDRFEMEAWLLCYAEKNPDFRNALINGDAKGAITKAIGKAWRDGITVTFVAEAKNEFVLVHKFHGAVSKGRRPIKGPHHVYAKYVHFARKLSKLQVFDHDFKGALKTPNPHSALGRMLGLSLDSSIKIRELWETKDQVYVVLRHPVYHGRWQSGEEASE
ncbi:MAG: hypothetical protein ACJ76J_07415 [Thermoanaerobaculia bacterium]